MGEDRDYWPHYAEQTGAPKLSHNSHQPAHDSPVPDPPPRSVPGDVLWTGGGRGWHQLSPRTRPWPILHPAPARAPALPEALKGPDCTQEVSEQQLHEYMKESFVQVSRSGGWGLWAGGLPGSEGSSMSSWPGSPQRKLGQGQGQIQGPV